MKTLKLSETSFNGVLPPSIGNLENLSWIDISKSNFIGTIPKTLGSLTQLEHLDFSFNNFTGPIPRFIFELETLEALYLSTNRFSGNIQLSWTQKLQNLKFLDLSYNNLTVDTSGNSSIFPQLEVLVLTSCNLRTFPDLDNQSRLAWLDLSDNNINGVVPLIDNHPLGYLSLSNNSLTGPIPTSICNFANLEVLDLSDNHLNSITLSNKGHQTEYVKILEVFKSIDFSSNNFDGTIPQVMGKFTALQILNLSHNAFTSQIPSVLGNLSNLESLDLSNNRLTGRIPKELADMSFLAVLNLSDNNLNGSIPIGSQFQTFDNTSFGGNPNLCGQPLFKSCFAPPAPPKIIVGESTTSINWDLLSKAFGFIFGLGVVMLPAALWPSFRVWYWPKIDYLLIWMFPKIYLKDRNNRLRTRRRQQRRSKQTMTSSQQNHSPAISCT
ncbi:Receptor-like protein 33 [Linum perenne]